MGPVVVALLLAIGASTWIYSKFMRTTGNNGRSSIVAAGVAGLFIFGLAWMIANFLGL